LHRKPLETTRHKPDTTICR